MPPPLCCSHKYTSSPAARLCVFVHAFYCICHKFTHRRVSKLFSEFNFEHTAIYLGSLGCVRASVRVCVCLCLL